jgi:hypothetical protein
MSDRIDIGTRKGFFSYQRDASGWKLTTQAFLGQHVPMLLNDGDALYAAVELGHFGTKLHRSINGGETWEELEAPIYPPKPDDVPDVLDPWRNTPVPWSLEKIWSLESAGVAGHLWCGTIPGGLFHSSNRGETWELVRSLWDRPERAQWSGGGYDHPGIHSICVHPDDPKQVAVAISCGGVWLTADGGETWTQGAHGMRYDFLPEDQGGANPEGQDPHRMVRCLAAPGHFWVQHHCGIYRSDTNAHSWTEIKEVSPSVFGFAVAVHPHDPDTAWFVPAKKDEFRYPVDGKFVVIRTRDGGKSFETLDCGLPDELAFDLVYRHGLDVDRTGQRLAMGSTTGSIWVSEDQGDSWQQLSAQLPPIYCVRFA